MSNLCMNKNTKYFFCILLKPLNAANKKHKQLGNIVVLKRYSHAVWVKKFMFDIRLDY